MSRFIQCAGKAIRRWAVLFVMVLMLVPGIHQTRAVVTATVNFSASTGKAINPSFNGLSYEKKNLTGNFFNADNAALINLFRQIGPGVLRIGGGTVDSTCWGGLGGKTPITADEVDQFAGFVQALPANWSVIYGINFSVNTPANCAVEAAYAARALGPRLLGFEIGNEPDAYSANGIRATNFTYADFLKQWRPLELAARPYGKITGPASADDTKWTQNFGRDESGIISLLTQHYYAGDAKDYHPYSPVAMQRILAPHPHLARVAEWASTAADQHQVAYGFRMDECGSLCHGGLPGVSDTFGAALWSLDFMFTLVENGAQGVNFHCGGRSPYTPLADNGKAVNRVGPEFYAMKMFSLIPPGDAIPAKVSLSEKINFTAYGVKNRTGGMSILLNNKDTIKPLVTTINLGSSASMSALELSCTQNLYATKGMMLGGAAITTNGTWSGGVQRTLTPTNGEVTVEVPPVTALLMYPTP